MKRTLLAVALAGASLAACQTGTDTTSPAPSYEMPASYVPTAPDHSEDVKIQRCSPDAYGNIEANVAITNHSSKASTYTVTVIFETQDSGTQLGTGLVFADQLNPGQSTFQDATALEEAPAAGYKCRIGDVTRYAS